jgi:hypothetical protein
MSRSVSFAIAQHGPENAIVETSEIERFCDRSSALRRELLDALAAEPDRRRVFADIEDALAWARRRIASVHGGVWHPRTTEFGGHGPYRFLDDRQSRSGRWEMWMESTQHGCNPACCAAGRSRSCFWSNEPWAYSSRPGAAGGWRGL